MPAEQKRTAESWKRQQEFFNWRQMAEQEKKAREQAALRQQAQARSNWSNRVRLANEATRDAAAAAEANRRIPVQNLFGEAAPPPTPIEMFIGRQEQAQRQAQNAPVWDMMLYGEQKESVLPGQQKAGKLESFIRTQAGEDEFRIAGQRFSEGRPAAGAGWGLLGLAGLVPLAGDAAQLTAKGARAATAVNAAGDTARAAVGVGSVAEAQQDFARSFIDLNVPRRLNSSGEELATVPVYGDRLAFGVDPIVSGRLGRVQEVPRNPLEIMGVRPGTTEARSLISDYLAAVDAARKFGIPETDVDALLYMIRSNVPGARQAFENLVNAGERVPFSPLSRPSDVDLSGLVLVHGTDYAPQRAGADVLMNPAGDWRSSTGGKSLLDYVRDYDAAGRPADPGVYYPWRDTLHFSLNHRVSPVVGMGQQFDWSQKPFWVMSNLADVMDANPGALANLSRMDTFFVPPAGQSLRLPDASVLELPRPVGVRDVTTPTDYGDWTRQMDDKEYFDFLISEEIARRGGKVFPDSNEWLGAVRGSIGDADRRITEVARNMEVGTGRHFESPYYYAETDPYDLLYNMGRGQRLPGFIQGYRPSMSGNLYERILASNRLSGVSYGPVPLVDDGLNL